MTHGVGSCSGGGGGGGGGFSGGGFSGGGFTTHYYGSSRSRSRNGECDPECQKCCAASITGIGALICLMICCKDQNRKMRLGIMWFWIILIFASVGFGVGFGTYGKNLYSTSPSDMRQVEDKLSAEFCTGLKLSSPKLFSAYRFLGNPTRSQKKGIFNVTKSTHISADNYEFWGFYLLAGSTVKVTSCVTNSLNFYFIKGYDNLKTWIDDNYCSGCTIQTSYTGHCSGGKYPDTFSLNAYEDEEYYFVFANHWYTDTSANIQFSLNRVQYDLTNNTESCHNTTLCELHYSTYGSAETFVYTVPMADTDDIEMYTSCIHRNWIFVVIFYVFPMILGLIGTFLIFLFCKNKPKSVTSTAGSVNEDRVPFTYQGNTYQSLSAPPSYEETVKH